jgi:hypothetical protein
MSQMHHWKTPSESECAQQSGSTRYALLFSISVDRPGETAGGLNALHSQLNSALVKNYTYCIPLFLNR